MIDTSKYDGHSKGPWYWDGNLCNDEYSEKHGREQWCVFDWEEQLLGKEEDMRLIADSPLLLAEVKRLHEWLDKQNNTCPRCFESIAWGCENNKGGRDKDIRHCISCDYDSPYQTEMKKND